VSSWAFWSRVSIYSDLQREERLGQSNDAILEKLVVEVLFGRSSVLGVL
jgi:hypothetical protein